MENTWATALVQGKDVKVEVNLVFSGTSMRPIEFQVKYTIDGEPVFEKFANE
jgi:hypothetical protein